jgi:hypothetical protein
MSLLFVLSFLFISFVSSSQVVPDRRARVVSIMAASNNNTTVPVDIVGEQDPNNIVVEMDFVPPTLLQQVRSCYGDTPRGVIVTIWLAFVFIIGCLLKLLLWK